MTKDKWIWMPHAGHLIVGDHCWFHLNTYVGKHIVSTVGEWWPERISREIHAEVHNLKWFDENRHRRGDDFDHAYRKKFGFMEIGYNRIYETMVFEAIKTEDECCPYRQESGSEVDFDSYNDAGEAREGHMKMCKKWSKR